MIEENSKQLLDQLQGQKELIRENFFDYSTGMAFVTFQKVEQADLVWSFFNENEGSNKASLYLGQNLLQVQNAPNHLDFNWENVGKPKWYDTAYKCGIYMFILLYILTIPFIIVY